MALGSGVVHSCSRKPQMSLRESRSQTSGTYHHVFTKGLLEHMFSPASVKIQRLPYPLLPPELGEATMGCDGMWRMITGCLEKFRNQHLEATILGSQSSKLLTSVVFPFHASLTSPGPPPHPAPSIPASRTQSFPEPAAQAAKGTGEMRLVFFLSLSLSLLPATHPTPFSLWRDGPRHLE